MTEMIITDKSGISRRTLLKTTAASAIALPWLWRRPAFAADNIVNVLAFGGYEEPGMLDDFTAETGISVNLKVHDGSDEEMVAMVKTSPPGTFDVMTPTSSFIPGAAAAGVLMALNDADYPLADYFPIIANWAPTMVDGKRYAIVNRFGYYGITYNHTKYSEDDASSWGLLFDEAVKGKVALFDWYLPNMGCLSKYNGNANPYDLDAAAFEALGQTLVSLRPQVGMVGGTSQVQQALAGGTFDLAIAGEWVQAGMFASGLPFKAAVPKEGGVTWDQAPCIAANTPRPENAVKFLQYITGPAFQARLAVAKTYYSMVPNKLAAAALTTEQRELLNLADLDKFDSEFMAKLSPRKMPANDADWLSTWENFKNS
jgi:spermidine/putrescine transport system substrate-binding protein